MRRQGMGSGRGVLGNPALDGQVASQEKSSGEDALDDVTLFDAGEALVEALELVGQAAVIDAHEVEDCGVKLAEVHRVLGQVIRNRFSLRFRSSRARYRRGAR
jgi:hypothetical protein